MTKLSTGNYQAIVILPGTTGSSLVSDQSNENLTSAPLWPDQTVLEAIAGLPGAAASGLNVPLFAARPGGYSKNSGYVSLINAIVNAANKQTPGSFSAAYTNWPTNTPQNIEPNWKWFDSQLTGNTVIGWAYDWRQDNLVSAAMLMNLIAELVSYGFSNVILIGHSMGGLVARAYLESVGVNDKYRSVVTKLITLGTPHLGAPLAFAAMMSLLTANIKTCSGNANFIAPSISYLLPSLEQAAINNVFQMLFDFVNLDCDVSTYELPPPPQLQSSGNASVSQYVKFITDNNNNSYSIVPPAPINLPSGLQALMSTNKFNNNNLTAATNFFNGLNYTSVPSGVVYECIYGIVSKSNPSPQVCQTTTTVGVNYNPNLTPQLSTNDQDGQGDTVVPTVSAMFTGNPAVTSYPVYGADHASMATNSDIQNQVLTLLGLPVPTV